MPPWLYALIFIAVLSGIAATYDFFARRTRRGLDKRGPAGRLDPIGGVENTRSGTTTEATGIRGDGLGM